MNALSMNTGLQLWSNGRVHPYDVLNVNFTGTTGPDVAVELSDFTWSAVPDIEMVYICEKGEGKSYSIVIK